MRVSEDRKHHSGRLAMTEYEVPEDDGQTEEADHPERGADDEVRAQREGAHHFDGSSMQ
jgi:hypothetical protein